MVRAKYKRRHQFFSSVESASSVESGEDKWMGKTNGNGKKSVNHASRRDGNGGGGGGGVYRNGGVVGDGPTSVCELVRRRFSGTMLTRDRSTTELQSIVDAASDFDPEFDSEVRFYAPVGGDMDHEGARRPLMRA